MAERDPHRIEAQIQAQIHAAREQIEAANERANARAGRNLPVAIGLGVVLGVLLLASLLLFKGLYVVFCSVLVAFTLYELASALRFAGRDVPRIPLVVLGVGLQGATWFWGAAGLWYGTLLSIAVIAIYRLVEVAVAPSTRTGARAIATDISASAFCIAYCGVLGAFSVLLTKQEHGEWWTLGFLVLAIVNDTGALASGVLFGRTKLAPRISPGKTWEGFAGAGVLVVAAAIGYGILALDVPWWYGAIIGLAILTTATVGDLAESLIKRDLGIKDIGTFLPGHGGFLDRLDSSLPSAVVMYALYEIARLAAL
ncbi:phosphatidate cytidylyltransferase [Agrococcus jejuensis]|uniref:phosphatidate cytidylyltransferase n=1 Tax=Agrococcus jejuensis TaxID=399736 RepID=UPI0021B599AA|nr:phosphatidate cytidylyltransferase [Agrococcus jejuensis]